MEKQIDVFKVLKKAGLRPKSSWSQNFLVDSQVLDAIVQGACLKPDQVVVELGAGVGALSVRLARVAKKVLAVELDRDLVRVLKKEFENHPNVEVLAANAAKLDWKEIANRLGDSPTVVANLPYHMATPILFHLLSSSERFAQWILMFQRELAQRILAPVGSRKYGVIGILIGRLVKIESILDVPPDAFFPKPKVHSQVLRFVPLKTPLVEVLDSTWFAKIVKAAFGHRRKTIRNSLQKSLPQEHLPVLDQALASAGINPEERAEQVSIESFGKLADAFFLLNQEPSDCC